MYPELWMGMLRITNNLTRPSGGVQGAREVMLALLGKQEKACPRPSEKIGRPKMIIPHSSRAEMWDEANFF